MYKTFYNLGLVLSAFVVIGFLLFAPLLVLAEKHKINPQAEFLLTAQKAQLVAGEKIAEPEEAVGKLINTVLTYVGVITLVLIIYAGGLWATAQGNETKVEKAKKILLGGIIGLVIIFTAGIVVNFVITGIGASL